MIAGTIAKADGPEGLSGEVAGQPRLVTITRKKLVRRTDRDYSQRLRLGFQVAFLALNGWIGVQFYHWVRWAETAGGPGSCASGGRGRLAADCGADAVEVCACSRARFPRFIRRRSFYSRRLC